MNLNRKTSYKTSVRRFINEATWLEESDIPAITALKSAAEMLDKETTPPMLGQFRLLYNSLLKKKPESGEPDDDLDDMLDKRGM